MLRCGKVLRLGSNDEPPKLSALLKAIDTDQIAPLCLANRDPEGREQLLRHIALIVLDINEWFGSGIRPDQIEGVTKRIISAFPHLYLDDLYIFKEYCLSGRYGKLYGQLTPSVIIEWLSIYWNDRCDVVELENDTLHASTKEETPLSPDRWFKLAEKKTAK